MVHIDTPKERQSSEQANVEDISRTEEVEARCEPHLYERLGLQALCAVNLMPLTARMLGCQIFKKHINAIM